MPTCETTQFRPTVPYTIPDLDDAASPRTGWGIKAVEQPAVPDTSPDTSDNAELLRRAGENDEEAWQEILRCYGGRVLARVRTFRLQDADALDAVQMTWLRLAENTHRIHHPERLGGWLTTTAARECLHILRQARRVLIIKDPLVDRFADSTAGPEQCVIDAETARTLRNLVDGLPPRRRSLLEALLFTDQPAPYAELAASTGIPIGSIGPTRDRALRQLRQLLQDQHLTPSTLS